MDGRPSSSLKKLDVGGCIEIMQVAFRQFRKPTGWLVGLAGLSMNRGHEKVWRWGLEHIAIQPDAIVLDVGCGGGDAIKS